MKPKTYIFIDDSGDPGLQKSPSKFFIIAAIVISGESNKQTLVNAINAFRQTLGWHESHEFKFKSTKKKIILQFIAITNAHRYTAHVAILDKSKLSGKTRLNNTPTYYYVIKELLLRLDLNDSIISIDGSPSKRAANEAKTYLRKHLRQNSKSPQIRFVDSRTDSLIQLADIMAGSIARSLRADRTDAKVYKKTFGNKIIKIYEIDP